jgi:zinc-binding alcohol dehydrogenase/oxidoreductase
MRAFKIVETTSLAELALSEVPDPRPAAGEVLIQLRAAALNHRDLGMFDWDPDVSFILGADGSGVIEELGPGVVGLELGAPVIIYPALDWGEREDAFSPDFSILGWPRDGTFAELVVVPAENVASKPSHLSFVEAAALPLSGLTAYRAVISRAQILPGERLVIHGIGGGVALFALQFAKLAGASILVTTTAAGKADRARALGADLVVDSRASDWREAARTWTKGAGVDVVIDSVGGERFAESLLALRPGGRIITYGTTASGLSTVDVETIFWHQLNVLGSTMGSPRDFAAMIELANSTRLKPVVDSVWPLAEGRAALQHLAEGRQFGKVVLRMD